MESRSRVCLEHRNQKASWIGGDYSSPSPARSLPLTTTVPARMLMNLKLPTTGFCFGTHLPRLRAPGPRIHPHFFFHSFIHERCLFLSYDCSGREVPSGGDVKAGLTPWRLSVATVSCFQPARNIRCLKAFPGTVLASSSVVLVRALSLFVAFRRAKGRVWEALRK
ncbi:uncharacterized protein EV420DRAFT_861506 [Desarmillaria tabescens]|uniref:Uncharacterized protein n=1 Tax=Armillaria tabescens TaxID=1929756 RepID=A0AA39JRY7_ARMTA|nr:uncharacterized protein EV420DRAFT_861506 [Desarmillaria tabescens]KAK0447820.1 hypothetical protein EV420DRAFT_861506 [Desarmillaria tabescens]